MVGVLSPCLSFPQPLALSHFPAGISQKQRKFFSLSSSSLCWPLPWSGWTGLLGSAPPATLWALLESAPQVMHAPSHPLIFLQSSNLPLSFPQCCPTFPFICCSETSPRNPFRGSTPFNIRRGGGRTSQTTHSLYFPLTHLVGFCSTIRSATVKNSMLD